MVTLWSATQEVVSSNNPFLQLIFVTEFSKNLFNLDLTIEGLPPLPDMLTPVQLGHHHRIPSDVVKHVHVGRLTFDSNAFLFPTVSANSGYYCVFELNNLNLRNVLKFFTSLVAGK